MVAQQLPEWQQRVMKIVQPILEAEPLDEKKLITALHEDKENVGSKKLMNFVAHVREQYKMKGPQAFELKLPFDEKMFLEENIAFIKSSLNMQDILVALPSEEFKDKVQPLEATVVFSE